MPSDAPNKMFRIKVGKEEIRVEREAGADDIPICKITKDDLQFRTTKVLVDMLRQGRLNDRDEYQILGENLYTILFANKVGAELKAAFQQSGLEFVRVELEFEEGREDLASLPWEYVYLPENSDGGGYFLAQKKKVVLTRRLRMEKSRSLRIDKPPLKVLFVASSPKQKILNLRTGQQEEIDFRVEYDKVLELMQSFDPETIKVTALLPYEKDQNTGQITPRATWKNFVAMLENEEFHAIHFLGHGRWEEKKGTILFMKKDGTPEPMAEDDLASTLDDYQSIRLVFLQACESAFSDPYQAFSGVAQQLAQKKIPAVVGMQYKIHQEVANAFACEFYTALAGKSKVDVALQKARWKIATEHSGSLDRLSFGLPVLYLRESESLFESVVPAAPAASAVSAAPAAKATPLELVTCPWCSSRKNNIDDTFCGECDGSLICTNCQKRVDRSRRSCGKCRAVLTAGRLSGESSTSTLPQGDVLKVAKASTAALGETQAGTAAFGETR